VPSVGKVVSDSGVSEMATARSRFGVPADSRKPDSSCSVTTPATYTRRSSVSAWPRISASSSLPGARSPSAVDSHGCAPRSSANVARCRGKGGPKTTVSARSSATSRPLSSSSLSPSPCAQAIACARVATTTCASGRAGPTPRSVPSSNVKPSAGAPGIGGGGGGCGVSSEMGMAREVVIRESYSGAQGSVSGAHVSESTRRLRRTAIIEHQCALWPAQGGEPTGESALHPAVTFREAAPDAVIHAIHVS